MKTNKKWCVSLASLLIFAGFGLSGCSPVIQVGRLPDVSRIEKDLILKVSTRDDVLRILETPKGDGGIFLPIDKHARDCWFYYYEESTMQNNQRIFLFILFDGDYYDGYMWFSSFPASITSVP